MIASTFQLKLIVAVTLTLAACCAGTEEGTGIKTPLHMSQRRRLGILFHQTPFRDHLLEVLEGLETRKQIILDLTLGTTTDCSTCDAQGTVPCPKSECPKKTGWLSSHPCPQGSCRKTCPTCHGTTITTKYGNGRMGQLRGLEREIARLKTQIKAQNQRSLEGRRRLPTDYDDEDGGDYGLPDEIFQVGDRVEVKLPNYEGWYPGTVVKCRSSWSEEQKKGSKYVVKCDCGVTTLAGGWAWDGEIRPEESLTSESESEESSDSESEDSLSRPDCVCSYVQLVLNWGCTCPASQS